MTKGENRVFDETYNRYLERIGKISLKDRAPVLGITLEGDTAIVPFFDNPCRVSASGICDASGKRPPHDICVMLSNYLLQCPSAVPAERDLVSFRDFRDSAPLVSYFANDVERPLASLFAGRRRALEAACRKRGGGYEDTGAAYDIAVSFRVLPKIMVALLFNDTDEMFPAACSVLFEKRAEAYLDAECLAMAGRQVYVHLKEADGE